MLDHPPPRLRPGKPFSRREYRCRSGLHRPGCGGSTPPSCRVLCRRPPGLQALQRCSGLLNRRARGSTVATHHLNAPVAQYIERRASNAEVAGEIPAGSANLRRVWLPKPATVWSPKKGCSLRETWCPTTRGAPLRTERLWVELPHAVPITHRSRSPMQRRRI
jgi:hypothetical protein